MLHAQRKGNKYEKREQVLLNYHRMLLSGGTGWPALTLAVEVIHGAVSDPNQLVRQPWAVHYAQQFHVDCLPRTQGSKKVQFLRRDSQE